MSDRDEFYGEKLNKRREKGMPEGEVGGYYFI